MTSEWTCSVCLEDNVYPMVLINCGHGICETCGEKMKLCPECRKKNTGIVPNYVLGKILGREYMKVNEKPLITEAKPSKTEMQTMFEQQNSTLRLLESLENRLKMLENHALK